MSLIKLASTPILVINHTDPNSGSSKTFSPRNALAVGVGGTTGFATKEVIEHIPKFNKLKMPHRFASRMGSVAGGFLGAATVYKALNKKKEDTAELYSL